MVDLLVSVIIPVYNAEKKLERCLKSVLSQSYHGIEVLLIDDGSTDGSLGICRTFEQSDPRVHVYSQKNSGPAVARNIALSDARGEYIQFVDSDDYLSEHAIQTLVEGMSGHDLVISNFNMVYQSSNSVRGLITDDYSIDRIKFLHEFMRHPGSFYYSALWNKLYKKSIIDDLALRFDSKFSWGEDFAFNIAYYEKVSQIHFVPFSAYNYVRSTGGQSWRNLYKIPEAIRIKYHLYKLLKELYVKEGLYHQNRKVIDRYLINITFFD